MPTAGTLTHLPKNLHQDAVAVLMTLNTRPAALSKKELFDALQIRRYRGDKVITILESLGLIDWTEAGPAKTYALTSRGEQAAASLARHTPAPAPGEINNQRDPGL